MRERKLGSTSYPIVFLAVQSADHITPATGATFSASISHNGGSFAAPTGAVTELGNGWYKFAGHANDRSTLGEVALHLEATGVDPVDLYYQVVSHDPYGLGDAYQALLLYTDDEANSQDRYDVVWLKNGNPVSAASPTITVVNRITEIDLVTAAAMTQVGSTYAYSYDEGTDRMSVGVPYLAELEATIDGATRTWYVPVSRDSA